MRRIDDFGYNDRNELTSSHRAPGTDAASVANWFDYAYDAIGNRTASTRYEFDDLAEPPDPQQIESTATY